MKAEVELKKAYFLPFSKNLQCFNVESTLIFSDLQGTQAPATVKYSWSS